MRFPTIARDFWQLRSAEESHRRHPDAFWIPPAERRRALERGQAARLIFDIEGVEEDGSTSVQGERMWVLVAGRRDGAYVGILDNEPALVETGEGVYLFQGAEIPFLPEHVIDIDDPPAEYAAARLREPPTRRWPPEGGADEPAV